MGSFISKVMKSFGCALVGIKYCIMTQRNMKIHMLAAILALFLAYALKLSVIEVLILVVTISCVIAAELLNTALESIVDLVSPAKHPLAKRAKDVAAGAVLCTAVAAVVVGYFLFLVKLL